MSPAERHLFRVNIRSGKAQRLTRESGWHTCQISPDGSFFIDTWSELNTPMVVSIIQTDGKKPKEIYRAKDLKGKLLICQGAIDKTVVWEHSLSFVDACIKEGVQLDYFPYPTHEHNVRGQERVHLNAEGYRLFQ